MVRNDRHPVIDQWLRNQFGGEGELLLSTEQLTGMTLASVRPDPPEFSEDVLTAWRHVLVRHRLTVNQSEVAFIERAREYGWSWQYIAELLGLSTAEAAEQHLEALKAEVARAHPSANPRPYLP